MGDFGFQKLEIYSLAKELVIYSYKLTKSFPDEERYSLVQQLNRAAISVPSNISEGYARESIKDKCHFLNMAYGSLMELVCQYEISKALEYINQEDYEKIANKAKNLSVKISNFKKYLQGRNESE